MELIMVPGRITFAAILYPQCRDDRTLAVHGLFINLAFGTSVTTPYLFMFVNRLIIAGAIISTRVMISIFVGYYGVHRPADAHRLRYLLFPIISMLGSALCLALITLLTIFLYQKKATERICQVICEV